MTDNKIEGIKMKLDKGKKFIREFKRDWQLYLLSLLPVIYVVIFNYGPMYGVQMAFRDYLPIHGITESEWIGLKWFAKFIGSVKFKEVFSNTVILSLYSMVATFPLPIIFALMLNALRSDKYKRAAQTISYLPHFISTTVVVAILNMVLSPINGIYGNFFRLLGGTGYPKDFRTTAEAFRHLYVWSGVWKGLGWDSIIYVAALSGVSHELHEAAQLDGATRLKRMIHVDLPSILPTVCILLIMRCGSLVSVGFDKAYQMQTTTNLKTSEVISTYVFKVGMGSFKDFSYGAAVGLFNSAINLTLLLVVNRITKKMTENEVSLF